MTIESCYLPDRGDTDNALGLSDEELAARNVMTLDIASEDCIRMGQETNVNQYVSTKSGRGALEANVWIRQADPVMCSYKVCRLDIPQHRIAMYGQRFLQASFIHYNRQVLTWMDRWFGLTAAEIGLPTAMATDIPSNTDVPKITSTDHRRMMNSNQPMVVAAQPITAPVQATVATTTAASPSVAQNRLQAAADKARSVVPAELASDAIGRACAAIFACADASNPFV